VAQEFLRRQLSHAMPLPFERLEDSGENRVFVAERDSLRFVAPMPGHLSRGGPHVQWLTIESDVEGRRLTFDHAQLNGYDVDDPKKGNPRDPVTLVEDVEDVRFEYRALDEGGELTDWMDSWDDPQRLPLMVRVVVEFERDSRRRWPELDVALLSATATPGFFNLNRGASPVDAPRPVPPGGEQ
jgi:general secretion pathway protein J